MKKSVSLLALLAYSTFANAEVVHQKQIDVKLKASRLNCEVRQNLVPENYPDYAFVTLDMGQLYGGSVFDFQKFTSIRNPLNLVDSTGAASCEKIEALKATADARGLIEVNIRSFSSVSDNDSPGSFFYGKVVVRETMNLTFKNGLVLSDEKWKVVSLRDAVSIVSSED